MFPTVHKDADEHTVKRLEAKNMPKLTVQGKTITTRRRWINIGLAKKARLMTKVLPFRHDFATQRVSCKKR